MTQKHGQNFFKGLSQRHVQKIQAMLRRVSSRNKTEETAEKGGFCSEHMNVAVHAFKQTMSAAEVVVQIQKSFQLESIYYIYVIDDEAQLVGVLSLRELLQAQGKRLLKDFMTRKITTVKPHDSRETAARHFEENGFVSLPVVDKAGRLLGLITVDDVVENPLEGLGKGFALDLNGIASEAMDFFGLSNLRDKLGGYLLMFFGGVLCAEVMLFHFKQSHFSVVCLFFLPLVLRLGSNLALQSLTFVNEMGSSLLLGWHRVARVLASFVGITLGLLLFFSLSLVCYAGIRFSVPFGLAMRLGLGVMAVGFFSMTLGMILPGGFRRIGLSPQHTASRLIHFFMDVLIVLVFLAVVWNKGVH